MYKATVTIRSSWGDEWTTVIEEADHSRFYAMVTGTVAGACDAKGMVVGLVTERVA